MHGHAEAIDRMPCEYALEVDLHGAAIQRYESVRIVRRESCETLRKAVTDGEKRGNLSVEEMPTEAAIRIGEFLPPVRIASWHQLRCSFGLVLRPVVPTCIAARRAGWDRCNNRCGGRALGLVEEPPELDREDRMTLTSPGILLALPQETGELARIPVTWQLPQDPFPVAETAKGNSDQHDVVPICRPGLPRLPQTPLENLRCVQRPDVSDERAIRLSHALRHESDRLVRALGNRRCRWQLRCIGSCRRHLGAEQTAPPTRLCWCRRGRRVADRCIRIESAVALALRIVRVRTLRRWRRRGRRCSRRTRGRRRRVINADALTLSTSLVLPDRTFRNVRTGRPGGRRVRGCLRRRGVRHDYDRCSGRRSWRNTQPRSDDAIIWCARDCCCRTRRGTRSARRARRDREGHTGRRCPGGHRGLGRRTAGGVGRRRCVGRRAGRTRRGTRGECRGRRNSCTGRRCRRGNRRIGDGRLHRGRRVRTRRGEARCQGRRVRGGCGSCGGRRNSCRRVRPRGRIGCPHRSCTCAWRITCHWRCRHLYYDHLDPLEQLVLRMNCVAREQVYATTEVVALLTLLGCRQPRDVAHLLTGNRDDDRLSLVRHGDDVRVLRARSDDRMALNRNSRRDGRADWVLLQVAAQHVRELRVCDSAGRSGVPHLLHLRVLCRITSNLSPVPPRVVLRSVRSLALEELLHPLDTVQSLLAEGGVCDGLLGVGRWLHGCGHRLAARLRFCIHEERESEQQQTDDDTHC